MSRRNFTLKGLAAALATTLVSSCNYPRVEGPYTFDRVRPVYTSRSTDESAINSTLEELERIPDSIQRIGNRHANIILFAGRITDQPEFSHYQGLRHPTAGDWNDIDGCYNYERRQIFINVYQSPGRTHSLELHEYGHMIDGALGNISERPHFKHVFEQHASETFLGLQLMSPHEASSPKEFFANCFANYYDSSTSREQFRKQYPAAFEYFERLDEQLNR